MAHACDVADGRMENRTRTEGAASQGAEDAPARLAPGAEGLHPAGYVIAIDPGTTRNSARDERDRS